VAYSGINIFRIAESRIAQIWDLYDRLWMWQQLGVFSDVKDAIAKKKSKAISTGHREHGITPHPGIPRGAHPAGLPVCGRRCMIGLI
jgi:hypothetical protein